jgi:phage FluMu protein Com
LNTKIEIRCRNGHCNRLFMNYYVTGDNVNLNLAGFEMKCEKCKRVLRLRNYTEKILMEHSENGVFRV